MSQALSGKTEPRFSVKLQHVYAPIQESLNRVNQILVSQTEQAGSLLAERLRHSGLSSGKRIRPAMLLLAGACFGDLKKTHIAAAAAVELVHAATLIHDDVLDGAEQRRHETAMHLRWDNTTSILTGDIIFTRAFEVACESGSLDVIRRIAKASSLVCEGEIIQNAEAGNFEIDEDTYRQIIALKTAELCKCACGIGATLSECDPLNAEKFEVFGQNLGIAFQIIDDILDIVGRAERVGKTLGSDLTNQKITLPMIHCLGQLDASRRQDVLAQLAASSIHSDALQRLLAETDSINYARGIARQYATSAFQFTATLADGPPAQSLRKLAEFVIERTY